MKVQFIRELSDPAARRFAFEATVFKSKACQGFVGYGDADPSNVSELNVFRTLLDFHHNYRLNHLKRCSGESLAINAAIRLVASAGSTE